MFIKVCIAGAVAFGLVVTIPIASFAAGDNDKSASSAKGTVHHKKLKKGFSDTMDENVGYLYGSAPACASPSLEYGYMDTQSYGPIGASALG